MTFMERVTAGSAVIVAVAAALAVIGRTLRQAHHMMKRITALLDTLNGTPEQDGHPARPGVAERLDMITATLDQHGQRLVAIEAQVTPNGGTTGRLGDTVSRIATATGAREATS